MISNIICQVVVSRILIINELYVTYMRHKNKADKKSHTWSNDPYTTCNSILSYLSQCVCLVTCTSETTQGEAVNFMAMSFSKFKLCLLINSISRAYFCLNEKSFLSYNKRNMFLTTWGHKQFKYSCLMRNNSLWKLLTAYLNKTSPIRHCIASLSTYENQT